MAQVSLKSIHDRMKQKLQLQEIATLEAKAREIETVLRVLKTKIKSDDMIATDNIIDSALLQEIRESASKQLGFKATTLFGHSHGKYFKKAKNMGADDIFEVEVAAVLAEIQKRATGNTNITYKDFLGGRDPVTVYSKGLKEKVPPRVGKKVAAQANANIKEGEKFSSRSKKGDIVVETISGKIAPEYERLAQLFAGYSFTLKNYSSVFEIDSLHLGDTKPDKAIRGALYHLGYRVNFNQAISALSSDEGLSHQQHLIFAYELAGWGQGTGAGKNFIALPEVDFIIYNDPAVPGSVAVRSTKKIIYDKVERNTIGLRKNNIAKSYFGMKEFEYRDQIKSKKK